MSDEIMVSTAGVVATITLNRPPHNALNPPLLEGLAAAADELAGREDVRLVVLRGTGGFAFCAGGDIDWMRANDPFEWNVIARAVIGRAIDKIAALPMPVIAAVDGFALGGGMELALACDLVVATDRARFGLPEVRLGVFPGGGGTVRLARSVGLNRARDLILTGRQITADEARAMGVVTVVADDLDAAIEPIATALRRCAPTAVRFAKRAVMHAVDASERAGLDYEADLVSLLFGGHEQREGFTAFGEHRPPAFDLGR